MSGVEEGALYLRIGELQAGDGEDHLPSGHEEVLRELPGHVDGVWLDVLHRPNALVALRDTHGR